MKICGNWKQLLKSKIYLFVRISLLVVCFDYDIPFRLAREFLHMDFFDIVLKGIETKNNSCFYNIEGKIIKVIQIDCLMLLFIQFIYRQVQASYVCFPYRHCTFRRPCSSIYHCSNNRNLVHYLVASFFRQGKNLHRGGNHTQYLQKC